MSRSSQLVPRVWACFRASAARHTARGTLAVHLCASRPRQLQPVRGRQRCAASAGFSGFASGWSAISSCKRGPDVRFHTANADGADAHQRKADSCHKGDGDEVVVQVGRGWTPNRTQSSGCAKSTTTRLLDRPRPPHGLAIRQPPCEEMAIFAVRLNVPDATAAAGPPVRLGSWLTSALARAGRELSRAILGSPRDQRTAEEGLPQWPLANEACLTRYVR